MNTGKITLVPVVTKSEEARIRNNSTVPVIRYVVTHFSKKAGMRTLLYPAQGRFTFATREEAQQMLDAMVANNSRSTLESLFGLPLEVRPCPCWPVHFDPVGVWFEENPK